MGEEGNSTMLVIVTAVVGVVAMVSLIIASVAMSKVNTADPPTININTGGSSSAGGGSVETLADYFTKPEDMTYRIAIGHDFGAHEYLDEAGYLQGFTIDLILKVCGDFNLQCEMVWDKYTNCWNSQPGKHSFGGEGLMGNWYEACAGWAPTVGRSQVFGFSRPFLEAPTSYLWAKGGSVPSEVTELKGKTVGFLDGWADDEICLRRQPGISNSVLSLAQIKHFDSPRDLAKAIIDRKVDYGVAPEMLLNETLVDVQPIRGTPLNCTTGGLSIMTRKGSLFLDLFNQGLQKIQESGEYEKHCGESKREQHAKAGVFGKCLDKSMWMGQQP